MLKAKAIHNKWFTCDDALPINNSAWWRASPVSERSHYRMNFLNSRLSADRCEIPVGKYGLRNYNLIRFKINDVSICAPSIPPSTCVTLSFYILLNFLFDKAKSPTGGEYVKSADIISSKDGHISNKHLDARTLLLCDRWKISQFHMNMLRSQTEKKGRASTE